MKQSTKTTSAAEAVLRGDVRGWKRILPFLGPAFIAAVAYIDPGNFATNIAAGSTYGYQLLWVIAFSNLMAVLIQSLSAKLGIATGRNLPEVARDRFSKKTSIFLWVQSELVIIATDLAEFIGAALGLHLIFGIGMVPSAIITAVASLPSWKCNAEDTGRSRRRSPPWSSWSSLHSPCRHFSPSRTGQLSVWGSSRHPLREQRASSSPQESLGLPSCPRDLPSFRSDEQADRRTFGKGKETDLPL